MLGQRNVYNMKLIIKQPVWLVNILKIQYFNIYNKNNKIQSLVSMTECSIVLAQHQF